MTRIRTRERPISRMKETAPGEVKPFPSEEEIEQVGDEHGSYTSEFVKDLEETFPLEAREAAIVRTAEQLAGRAETNSPAVHLRSAFSVHDARYGQEYALRMLHRLLLRNVSIEKIAQTFEVSVITIYRWKRKLKDALTREAARIEANPLIGEGVSFFNEIRGMALQEAMADKITSGEKMRALEVALKAERDKHAMLGLWGVNQAKRYNPEVAGYKPGEDAMDITQAITSIIEGTEDNIIEGELAKDDDDISILG